MTGILDGIRVLDFGRFIAGPYCATLLADLGAEVIRVERIGGGEDRYTTPVTSQGEGAGFLQWGRNKRGMTLNPTCDEGRGIVEKLVRSADIVVANLPPASLTALGLDYESLCTIRPDIILTTATAFGSSGPYAERVGFDGVAQAMSGNMHLTGYADEPMKNNFPYVDYSTAAFTALGTLAALIHRNESGEGQHVEGSLLATSITIGNAALIEQSQLGINRVGSGNRGQTAAPSDTFKTRDGWILVQVVGNPIYRRWADLMGEPEWLDDLLFGTDELRGNNAEAISQRMARWCETRTTSEAMECLVAARIPCGEVLSPEQTLRNEQVLNSDILERVDYPGLNTPAPVARIPVTLSKTPPEIRNAPPTLGQDSAEILSELGYSDVEIADLKQKRVI